MNPQDPAFDNPDPETASRALARRHAIEELLDRRRTAAVRPLIAAALREDPYDAELLYLAARADWIDDANTSAREHLTQLLQREPHHTPARALLVMVLTEENQLPQAEEIVLSLLREHPRWPHLYVLYARVMLHALNVEKASALASEALRMAPDDADALRLRALCDLVQGTRGAQGPALQRLLAGHPEDQATVATLAAALVTAGRHRAALRCYRELLQADPTNPHWLRLTKELTAATHWSLLPLWPFQRYGWAGSIGLWIATIIGVRLLAVHAPAWAGPVSWALFGYVAYSWIWPPLLRKWILRN
jgi:predicted Zn-dependent protease